ncbi:ABC transporter substrate-binding protein [Streptomyces sp. NBC_00859]|uniref:ABC transporter substrate-binding protein n=1 Tax=Streptomyces sp. NBC_00859 TaxID=2903682 RepID=UPI00386316B2|nr:ABC transporter substrate-binding protein [Streptomyces sp. NBC_00859]
MPNARASHFSRRGILAAGGVIGIGAALSACGSSDSKSSGSAKSGSGPWSFKDDRGITAKADATPTKIVAFTGTAAALHDYGVEVAAVFGPTKTKDGKADVQAGDLDISKVEILGNVWGEFNVEKYAAIGPQLLITGMYDKGALWYVPDESKSKILKLAPSTALMVARTSMPAALERHAELAKSLGADLKAKKVTDAKARFEKAAARLRAAAKANPKIKVLIGSASADLLYISTPAPSADLRYFKELGVNLVVPDKVDKAGWFESLSWENADKYPADIIMMDNRTSALQPSALTSKPTWGDLPAVKAGQVIPRSTTDPIFSYDKCAPALEALAKAIENAKKVS